MPARKKFKAGDWVIIKKSSIKSRIGKKFEIDEVSDEYYGADVVWFKGINGEDKGEYFEDLEMASKEMPKQKLRGKDVLGKINRLLKIVKNV